MSDDLPVCGKCGKPVCKPSAGSTWRHYYVEDLLGHCYWGRPGKPNE